MQVTGSDGYQAILAWGEIDPGWEGKDVLVAYMEDGQPLNSDGMACLVVPGDLSGGRYVSNVTSITLSRAGGSTAASAIAAPAGPASQP